MEVVSASNLVSWETEKKEQSVILNMIMPWEAKEEAMYIYKYEAIHSFMIAKMWKSTLRNIKTKQQNQTQPAISNRRNLFYFENTLFIRAKEGW